MNSSPLHDNEHGFSLIELMIVVAIIGILAVVVVPTYFSYTQRARVTSMVIPSVHTIESNVGEFYAMNGTMVHNSTDEVKMLANADTTYLTGLSVSDTGVIRMTVDAVSNTMRLNALNGKALTVTPDYGQNKTFKWTLSGELKDFVKLKN